MPLVCRLAAQDNRNVEACLDGFLEQESLEGDNQVSQGEVFRGAVSKPYSYWREPHYRCTSVLTDACAILLLKAIREKVHGREQNGEDRWGSNGPRLCYRSNPSSLVPRD